eukprot:RCo009811
MVRTTAPPRRAVFPVAALSEASDGSFGFDLHHTSEAAGSSEFALPGVGAVSSAPPPPPPPVRKVFSRLNPAPIKQPLAPLAESEGGKPPSMSVAVGQQTSGVRIGGAIRGKSAGAKYKGEALARMKHEVRRGALQHLFERLEQQVSSAPAVAAPITPLSKQQLRQSTAVFRTPVRAPRADPGSPADHTERLPQKLNISHPSHSRSGSQTGSTDSSSQDTSEGSPGSTSVAQKSNLRGLEDLYVTPASSQPQGVLNACISGDFLFQTSVERSSAVQHAVVRDDLQFMLHSTGPQFTAEQ